MLPDEFIASASARGWKVPPKDQVSWRAKADYDYSPWLQWAKDLPDVPDAHTLPDSGVLERFCLTMQEPETDDPDQNRDTDNSDQQMKVFKESVWYKVRKEFGRYEVEFGMGTSNLDIESISVRHWDLVVRQALDGLNRFGLRDRVKLICSEPDPDDWQRDRHFTVWPREIDYLAKREMMTALGLQWQPTR